jgi:hypothetical protein
MPLQSTFTFGMTRMRSGLLADYHLAAADGGFG